MNDFSLYMQVLVTVLMQATYNISPSVLASEHVRTFPWGYQNSGW